MDYAAMLKASVNETMSVPEIVDAFEKMCQEPIDNDMILFETGTFTFHTINREPRFYFSLVRQFPIENDDEYYQIHVDILFLPDSINRTFSGAVWNEDIEENIFDYIRNSKAFAYAESAAYEQIKIYMDEI